MLTISEGFILDQAEFFYPIKQESIEMLKERIVKGGIINETKL
jgi:hypothetical protein